MRTAIKDLHCGAVETQPVAILDTGHRVDVHWLANYYPNSNIGCYQCGEVHCFCK